MDTKTTNIHQQKHLLAQFLRLMFLQYSHLPPPFFHEELYITFTIKLY